jgi:c-di-GMP-binding flagellar brake protein YcgR
MVLGHEEKRCFPRIKLHTPVHYQLRGSGEFNSTITDDISVGGIGCKNSGFIPPKTPLNLEINLLSRVLRPAGIVSWASPISHSDQYRLGVEFVEFDPREKDYLKDYIDFQLGKL